VCGADGQSSNKDAVVPSDGAAALAMKAEHVFKRTERRFYQCHHAITYVIINIFVCDLHLCFYLTLLKVSEVQTFVLLSCCPVNHITCVTCLSVSLSVQSILYRLLSFDLNS